MGTASGPWERYVHKRLLGPPLLKQQPSFPASLALPELTVHSVFTRKQWKTSTNKKPTPPYIAPAMFGHLVTTSLAKYGGRERLELPVQGTE